MEPTPAEIRKKEFRTVLRGVDPSEVRDFINQVAGNLELVLGEKEMFKQQLADMEERVSESRQLEQVLEDTLARANQTSAELRQAAMEDAERILKEANLEAESILNHAHQKLDNLKSTIRSLYGQKQAFLQEMEGILESYGRILKSLKKEANENATEA